MNDYICSTGINDYVKELKFIKNDELLGLYCFEDKTIYISWSTIMGLSLKEINDKKYEQYYKKFIETLFHELTHAKQYAYMEFKNCISDILSKSVSLGQSRRDLYKNKDYYSLFPHEYNAILESKINVSEFCNIYMIEDLEEMISEFIINSYIDKSPIEHIIKNYNSTICIPEMMKIQYGLPVKEECLGMIKDTNNSKIKKLIKVIN